MYNKELEKQLHDLFAELQKKAMKIASEAKTNTEATERIMRVVSGTISSEAEGYMVDMYACLAEVYKLLMAQRLKAFDLNVFSALKSDYLTVVFFL